MKRGAAVVYPKDAAQIVAFADVFPGARVLEAGAGSGALSCWLLRAVGEQGTLVSFERRPDFAEIARRNVEQFFGGAPPAWQLVVGEFAATTGLADFDRVVLDMLAPWDVRGRRRRGARARRPGLLLRRHDDPALAAPWRRCAGTAPSTSRPPGRAWSAPGTWRAWPSGPDHRMVGHTGFLVTARRLAPGVVPPPRRRRPRPEAGPQRPAKIDPRSERAPSLLRPGVNR